MYLVDTNVMLAASAVHELSNLAVRAMPQEVELREMLGDTDLPPLLRPKNNIIL